MKKGIPMKDILLNVMEQMAFRIATFNKMTFNKMTFNKMTFT